MYDVIIIGKGPAGISASLYVARAGMKCLVIGKGLGALEKAEKIENYYGIQNPISGKELAKIGIEQAKRLGVEIYDEEVVSINWNNFFIVKTVNNSYEAKSVILATGTERTTPPIKGIKEFEGKGVSYCAVCDSFFYRGKEVAVIGNGEYAMHELNELVPVVAKATMITDGKPCLVENRSKNINVVEKEVREIRGENKVEEITFSDNTKIKVDGVFIAIGTASSSDLAKKIGARVEGKNIVVNEKMATTVPGLFACGDCTGGLLQVAKAVDEGAKAGIEAISYVRSKK